MPCTNAANPTSPINDALILYDTWTGPYTFGIAGIGTRDHDFTVDGPVPLANPRVALSLPTLVINKAFLYWNTIGAKDQITDYIKFNGSDVFGAELAWCGNTAWPKDLAEDTGLPSWAASNIINKVWFTDVTSLMLDGNTIEIVGNKPDPSINVPASDSPHYPGCNGSQGILFFVVYDDPGADRLILHYHGAKLLVPAAYISSLGGSTSYDINLNPGKYFKEASFFTAVGDAQSTYADSLSWNGVPFSPSGPSYFWPIGGNLLHGLIENNVNAIEDSNNTVTASTTGDALCWFVGGYLGSSCNPPCPDGPDPTSPYDQLNPYQTFEGEYDVTGNGVGTRDKKVDITPASIPLDIPGEPFAAYLYWNVIGKKSLDISAAVFDGNDITGDEIGWCDNTCWQPSSTDDSFETIKNKVYRADVTNLVSQGFTNHTILLPNTSRFPEVAISASDEPHFPGCCGTQGIALIVVYKNCPKPGDGNCHPIKKILIYDGAKGIISEEFIEDMGGGTDTYDVVVDAGCAAVRSKIIVAAGDAQSEYSDDFTWNGTQVFPPNGFDSCINPNKGNLLFYNETNTTTITADGANTATMSTDEDCLCWFLLVYAGETGFCCERQGPDAPKDELKFYRGFQGDVDFTHGCAGIRDIDTNVTPAQVSVTVPGPVKAAYLYWNTIGQRDWNPSLAIFDGTPVEGCLLGWGGDTCWFRCSNELNLINRSYRANVTSLVSGSGIYSVSIPTQTTLPPNAANVVTVGMEPPQTVHMPGCCTGQGVVLLVVYETKHETFPDPSCCPVPPTCDTRVCSRNTVFVKRRQVLIYDGGVTIRPLPGVDGDPSSYSTLVTTHYKNNIKILAGVSDTQSTFEDTFYWDGNPFAENPYGSYFNNECGNLLQAKIENPNGSGECNCESQTHVATITTTDDCLHWFLYVYYGDNICLDSTIRITRMSPQVSVAQC